MLVLQGKTNILKAVAPACSCSVHAAQTDDHMNPAVPFTVNITEINYGPQTDFDILT